MLMQDIDARDHVTLPCSLIPRRADCHGGVTRPQGKSLTRDACPDIRDSDLFLIPLKKIGPVAYTSIVI